MNLSGKRSSLSKTLVLDNLVLMLLFAMIAILVIFIFTFNVLRAEAIQDTKTALFNGHIIVDQFFDDHFDQMDTLVLSSELILMDPEGSKPYLEGLLRKNPEYSDLALVSPSGREVIKVSRYEFIPREALKSHAVEGHFKDSLAGKRGIDDVAFEGGLPKIHLTVPVWRNPMEITGALEANIDLRSLSEWIGKMRSEALDEAYLVNRQGLIIAHTESRFALGETKANDLPSVRAALSGHVVVPYGPDSRYKNLQGKRVVAGTKILEPYGYILVVEKDEGALIFQGLPFVLGLMGVAFSALTSGFFWAISRVRRRVIQPISKLSIAIQEFEEGKEFSPVAPESRDEIGFMAEAFNKMAQNLHSTIKELRLSRSRQQVILENIPQGVYLLNSTGFVEYANQTVAKEMNKLQGDLAGMDVKSFMSSKYHQKFTEEWEKMRDKLTPFSFEMEYYSGKGKLEPGMIFLAPLSGTDGSFTGSVLLGVNLTKVKEDEKKRIQEERLASLGLMASKLSHELRNLLGAMSNAIYYLKQNLKDSEAKIKRHLEILEQQVDASSQLLSSILDFARPKEPMLYPVNLNQVIQQALERVTMPQGVEVKQKLDPDLPTVPGDAQLLMQVFINLITNAGQSMPNGGKVTLRTTIKDDMIAAEVQDTGTGIDPEFIKKFFQPFQTSKARGMGLGLSISKDTVERHGGRIEVESQVGQGTTFFVYLPVKKV